MNSIIEKVYNNIIENSMISPSDKVIVGLSGGPDSVMLLYALNNLKERLDFELCAAHVNHGIRGKSADDDCDFCQSLCDNLKIPLYKVKYDIPAISAKLKTSHENAGRIKRYEFFNSLCTKYGYNKIAIAHNMNDSVETVIINMIRGASLAGLGGIKPVNSNIIRPIYNISREEIENCILSENLTCCTDETNLTNDYTRNKVRNIILKEMAEINPSVVKTIFSNTKNIREDDEYLSKIAKEVNAIKICQNDVVINKKIFDSLDAPIKKRLICEAIIALKGSMHNIERKHIEILLEPLFSGKKYDLPSNITVYVSYDDLIFSDITKEHHSKMVPVAANTDIGFASQLITFVKTDVVDYSLPDTLYIDYDKVKGKLFLRQRQDGDKMTPYLMSGTKKIKHILAENKVPFTKRDSVPVLCDESGIVAVIPYRIDDKYKIDSKTCNVLRIQIQKEK